MTETKCVMCGCDVVVQRRTKKRRTCGHTCYMAMLRADERQAKAVLTAPDALTAAIEASDVQALRTLTNKLQQALAAYEDRQ